MKQVFRAKLRILENQIGQLATVLSNRLQGGLPNNTKGPKREGKEHCKVINLKSGKDVHFPIGVPKKEVEPTPIQEQTHVEEEPQQPTFQPTDMNTALA